MADGAIQPGKGHLVKAKWVGDMNLWTTEAVKSSPAPVTWGIKPDLSG